MNATVTRLIQRLRYWLRGQRAASELSEEIEFHRALKQEELEREGMPAHEAAVASRRALGNTLLAREQSADVWKWNWVDDVWKDFVHASRGLRKSPGFTIGAVLILGIGVGLNLTFFVLFNAAFFKPLRVHDVDSLVLLATTSSEFLPYPATQFLRSNNNVLSAVLTMAQIGEATWQGDATEPVRPAFVSTNWFEELGYSAVRGRLFEEATDEKPEAPPIVVISEEFWETRLQRDPQIIGKTVRLNDRPVVVVGIVPDSFPDLKVQRRQVWIPINQFDHIFPGVPLRTSWEGGVPGIFMYGRLRPGVSLSAGTTRLNAALAELASQRPGTFREKEQLVLYSGSDRFTRPRDRQGRLIVLGVGSLFTLLVLMIACANLSNLVLSRAVGRVQELSVRAALGATRWRIVRYLMAESALLAGMASVGGLLAGYWGARILGALVQGAASGDLGFDWRTGAAGAAVAIFTTFAVGLAPAWSVGQQNLATAMKDGGQQASSSLGRAQQRKILLAVQVFGSCVLLVIAGLMIRALQRTSAHPGFDVKDVVIIRDPSGRTAALQGQGGRDYWVAVRRLVAAHPEIESATLMAPGLLGERSTHFTDRIQESPGMVVTRSEVDSDFFRVMKIPLLGGRTFESSDTFDTSAVISRRLALAMYGTLDVLGKGFPRTKPARTIVGVAEDARLVQLAATNGAELYVPFRGYRHPVVLARSKPGAAVRILTDLSKIARSQDPRVSPVSRLLEASLDARLEEDQMLSGMLTGLGVVALSIACLGVFGVVSYGVTLRLKEIGIRRALGARGSSIVWLLMRQPLLPVILAIVVGMAVGVVAGQNVNPHPFDPQPKTLDITLLVGVTLALIATIGLATLIPALRALRADVVRSLRHD